MGFRRALFIAIAFIGLTGAASAQTLAFPALSGRVVDEAALLSPADRAALTDTLAALEAQNTDQLVVVTLKSLQGTTIEDYGYQLGRHWQIGQKDKNNGALLIVAPAEHAVRIEVGYGLEGDLTDAVSKFIIENSILPRFKANDFPGGIKRGVDDIVQVLTGDSGGLKQAAQKAADQQNADAPTWPAIILVLGGIGLLIYCATRGGGLCRGLAQILFMMLLSGRNSSQGGGGGGSSFSGGGGSFGGGGASGHW